MGARGVGPHRAAVRRRPADDRRRHRRGRRPPRAVRHDRRRGPGQGRAGRVAAGRRHGRPQRRRRAGGRDGRRTEARVLTFGTRGGDVRAEDIRVDDALRPAFRLRTPAGDADVRLAVHGVHQVTNALAAAAAGLAADVDLDAIVGGAGRRRAVGPADAARHAGVRGPRRQRRLQRQPHLDPRGPRRPRRAPGGAAGRRARHDGRARSRRCRGARAGGGPGPGPRHPGHLGGRARLRGRRVPTRSPTSTARWRGWARSTRTTRCW